MDLLGHHSCCGGHLRCGHGRHVALARERCKPAGASGHLGGVRALCCVVVVHAVPGRGAILCSSPVTRVYFSVCGRVVALVLSPHVFDTVLAFLRQSLVRCSHPYSHFCRLPSADCSHVNLTHFLFSPSLRRLYLTRGCPFRPWPHCLPMLTAQLCCICCGQESTRAHRWVLGYVCHELRNPVHVLKSTVGTVLEQLRRSQASPAFPRAGASTVPCCAVLPCAVLCSNCARYCCAHHVARVAVNVPALPNSAFQQERHIG